MVSLAIQQWRSRISTDQMDKTKKKDYIKQQLLSAFTLSLLFGLGWGFGLPASSGVSNLAARTVFQIIFVVLTAFQGVFIFVMHCLIGRKSVDVKREWKRWFYLLTCRRTKAKEYSHGATTFKHLSTGHRSQGLTMAARNTLALQRGHELRTFQKTASTSLLMHADSGVSMSIVEFNTDQDRETEHSQTKLTPELSLPNTQGSPTPEHLLQSICSEASPCDCDIHNSSLCVPPISPSYDSPAAADSDAVEMQFVLPTSTQDCLASSHTDTSPTGGQTNPVYSQLEQKQKELESILLENLML